MRLMIAILFMATAAFASGPKYIGTGTDSQVSQEFTNVYQDIRNPVINYASISTATIASLTATTATITALTVSSLTGFSSGKVLQMVFSTSTTPFSTTSSAFQTTNVSASITPTSSTSRIIILANGVIRSAAVQSSEVYASIFRGSTNLGGGTDSAIMRLQAAASTGDLSVPCAMAFVDSPASTSSITYAVKIANGNNSTSVAYNTAQKTAMALIEVAP